MRKMLAGGVGLVAAALAVTVLVWDRMWPTGPPLQAGMTIAEVNQALDPPRNEPIIFWHDRTSFFVKPDWRGNRYRIDAYFDDDFLLERWEVVPQPRVRPVWLERVLRFVGW
jgi:hypothetical protein